MINSLKSDGAVPLWRGSESISNFFSALGDLRETRLTAALAYLIANCPSVFAPLFINRPSSIERVQIEESADSRRYDIVIRSPNKIVVIEAKVGYEQSPSQVARYIRGLIKDESQKEITLCLLDRGGDNLQTEVREIRQKFPKCKVVFKTWSEVAKVIEKACLSKRLWNGYAGVINIAREIGDFLKENRMAATQAKEVYIRQLSGDSLDLFFRHHLYKCQAKFARSALQHLYFAPLFTAKAPKDFAERSMLPIERGLTYIARIEQGRVLKRNEVVEYLKTIGHPKAKEAAKEACRQYKAKELLILKLGEPFQLFQSPISTRRLGVKGMLAQKTMTFEELLETSRTGA